MDISGNEVLQSKVQDNKEAANDSTEEVSM